MRKLTGQAGLRQVKNRAMELGFEIKGYYGNYTISDERTDITCLNIQECHDILDKVEKRSCDNNVIAITCYKTGDGEIHETKEEAMAHQAILDMVKIFTENDLTIIECEEVVEIMKDNASEFINLLNDVHGGSTNDNNG